MARGSRISGVFEKAYKDAGHVGKILILLSFTEYEFEHHILIVTLILPRRLRTHMSALCCCNLQYFIWVTGERQVGQEGVVHNRVASSPLRCSDMQVH